MVVNSYTVDVDVVGGSDTSADVVLLFSLTVPFLKEEHCRAISSTISQRFDISLEDISLIQNTVRAKFKNVTLENIPDIIKDASELANTISQRAIDNE